LQSNQISREYIASEQISYLPPNSLSLVSEKMIDITQKLYSFKYLANTYKSCMHICM